jgi:hypothetical protein
MYRPMVCPDIFEDNVWVVKGSDGLEEAGTNRRARQMVVPSGDGPTEQAIRRHEMAHAAVGHPQSHALRGAMAAAEDLLMNHWVTHSAGLTLPVRMRDIYRGVPSQEEDVLPKLCAVHGTEAEEEFYKATRSAGGLVGIRAMKVRESIGKAIGEIDRLGYPGKATNVEVIKAMAKHLEPYVMPRGGRAGLMEMAGMSEDAHAWAKMTEITLPLTKRAPKLVGRKNIRPYRQGEYIQFPDRLTTDSKVFATKDRGGEGSLLVDCSGSMSWNMDSLQKVIDLSPRFVTGCYWGTNGVPDRGWLAIVSKRGKYHGQPPKQDGCGNKVDGPALRWLAKQPQPRFWMSDRGCTGIGDRGATQEMHEEVRQIEAEHRITNIRNLAGLVKALKVHQGRR